MLKPLLFTVGLMSPTTIASQMDNIIDFVGKALEVTNQTLPKIRGRSTVSMLLQDLQKYGCWCYFDDLHGQGKGTPVDRFDIECSKYHHAITCMKMESCDLSLGFNALISISSTSPLGFEYDCVSANGGDACKEALCYTTSYVSSNIMALMINEDTGALPKYNTYKKGFNQSTCKISGAGSSIDEEKCCGNYEFNTRRPVRVPSGRRRECCENSSGIFVTYNPDFKQCCSGSVESFGTC